MSVIFGPNILENNNTKVETDTNGDLVVTNVNTGGKFKYDSTNNNWIPVQGMDLNGGPVDNVGKVGVDSLPQHGVVQSTLEPEVADAGTTWARLDDSGTNIWDHSLHSNQIRSVFERNGVVYSGATNSTVIAADASDGSQIWSHSLHSNDVVSVFERNGVVYSGSADNTVIAADASDGSQIWSHSLHSGTVWSVFERNGVVYSGSSDNTVIAADASDGSQIWSHSLHSDNVRSVFERNGVVYSGSVDNTVIAADAFDGSQIWSHSLHSDDVYSVFERNGVVYSGSADNTVIAAVSDPTTHVSDGSEWIFEDRIEPDREGGQLG